VQAEPHVVVRPDPFGGIDYTPLEGAVDVGARDEDRRGARPRVDFAAKGYTNAHLETLVVGYRGHLFWNHPAICGAYVVLWRGTRLKAL
jgi:hypothetical protein